MKGKEHSLGGITCRKKTAVELSSPMHTNFKKKTKKTYRLFPKSFTFRHLFSLRFHLSVLPSLFISRHFFYFPVLAVYFFVHFFCLCRCCTPKKNGSIPVNFLFSFTASHCHPALCCYSKEITGLERENEFFLDPGRFFSFFLNFLSARIKQTKGYTANHITYHTPHCTLLSYCISTFKGLKLEKMEPPYFNVVTQFAYVFFDSNL